MTWISRNPKLYSEPLRIKKKKKITYPLSLGLNLEEGMEPGDVTKFMAIPWQADFNECSSQPLDDRFVWWWPSQRPLMVYTESEPTQPGRKRQQEPWIGIDYDQNAANYLMFPDDLEMVELWKELGFVFNVGTAEKPDFIEVERNLPRVEEPPE